MRTGKGNERCDACGEVIPVGSEAIGVIRGFVGKLDLVPLEEIGVFCSEKCFLKWFQERESVSRPGLKCRR